MQENEHIDRYSGDAKVRVKLSHAKGCAIWSSITRGAQLSTVQNNTKNAVNNLYDQTIAVEQRHGKGNTNQHQSQIINVRH